MTRPTTTAELLDLINGLDDRIDAAMERIEAHQTEINIANTAVDYAHKRIDSLEEAELEKPERDTSWRPYDAPGDFRPKDDQIVSVLIRGSDTPRPPQRAGRLHWEEMGELTIVAWRYASEDE